MPDAARPPGTGGKDNIDRVWAYRRALTPPLRRPPPPPHRAADGRRGEGGSSSGAGGRGTAGEGVGGRDTRRGGPADREVAVGATADHAAAGENAATGAGGETPPAREESGGGRGGGVGNKRPASLPAHPPPKRRPVSASRQFPPPGRNAVAPLAGADAGSRIRYEVARDNRGSGALEKPAVARSLAARKDGVRVLSGPVPPNAAGTRVLRKLCATDRAPPMTNTGYQGPRAGMAKSSAAYDRGRGARPDELRRKKVLVPVMRMPPKQDDDMAFSLEIKDILRSLVVHEGKFELSLSSSPGLPSVRFQRPYRYKNEDDRSRFKSLCRRFEIVCRALIRVMEKHSLKIRIDLEAANVMKNLPGFTKRGHIVGPVPGVEVGDEFIYRAQLAIAGLHSVYRGGINTTYQNGILIAISIVASGGYPDELGCSGELIYTGSGGNAAGKKKAEDQKLEGGNLALRNCIETKTPVRVIHGFKIRNTGTGSHSGTKLVSRYTYDGVYSVVNFWVDGQPGSRVFKYKLEKIPGQPELPMHISENLRKLNWRPGVCMVDLSQRREATPICVINTINDVRPAPFRYITRIKYPSGLTKKHHQGCDCTNGCSDSATCACAVKNGGEISFNLSGAIVNLKSVIFECGPSCKCPPSCHNKVTQNGMKIPLEVFRTTNTGWGVRSLWSIPSGSFICEYAGQLLHRKEADKRGKNSYLIDVGLNYDDENVCSGLLSTASGLNSSRSCSQTTKDVRFTVDASEYGNIGRFINHSCSPNLDARNVLWDHDDRRMPHIVFFAAETIPPLQELTYDYNYEIGNVRVENRRTEPKVCRCGSPQCRGRLY